MEPGGRTKAESAGAIAPAPPSPLRGSFGVPADFLQKYMDSMSKFCYICGNIGSGRGSAW